MISFKLNAIRKASACPPNLQVRLLIVQLAPTGLWQDGRAAAHPEVQPVAVCSNRAFRKLCKAAVAQCGRLPAPSRTPVDELLKAPKPAAAQPQGLGARLAQLAQGAGLAMGHMLAGPAQQWCQFCSLLGARTS